MKDVAVSETPINVTVIPALLGTVAVYDDATACPVIAWRVITYRDDRGYMGTRVDPIALTSRGAYVTANKKLQAVLFPDGSRDHTSE